MRNSVILILMFCGLTAGGQSWDDMREQMEKKMDKLTMRGSVVAPTYYHDGSVQLAKFTHIRFATIQTFDQSYEGVKGTPYISEEWMKGAALLSGSEEPQVALLNYDCVNDELLVRMEDGLPASLPKSHVHSFILYDEQETPRYRHFVVATPGTRDPRFCEVLHSGRTIFLVHPKKTFRKSDYQRAYSPGRKFDEYLDESIYYLKTEDGNWTKLKSGRKQVLALFPENRDLLEKYTEEQQLKLNTPGEIIRLLEYDDTL